MGVGVMLLGASAAKVNLVWDSAKGFRACFQVGLRFWAPGLRCGV